MSFSFCSSKNFFPFVCQSKKSNSLAVDFYFQGNFSMGTERTSLSLSSFTPLSGLLYKKIYIVVTKLKVQPAISQTHRNFLRGKSHVVRFQEMTKIVT